MKPLRSFLGIGFAAVAVLLALGVRPAVAADAPDKPNIVLILTDDLGYGDVSCLNPESKIQTPAIDRLAAQGMTFTDAHAPSTVCTPTRYSVLTGRYAFRGRSRTGVLGGYSPRLIEPGRLTVGEMLRQSGYDTGAIGKWHLGMDWPTKEKAEFGDTIAPKAKPELIDFTKPIPGGPLAVGFDYFYGISASLDMDPYVYIENDRVVEAPAGKVEAGKDMGFFRAGPIAPGFKHVEVLPRCVSKAEEYIARHAGTGRPFFLYLALPSPHSPILPSPEFAGKSKAGQYGDYVMETDDSAARVVAALEKAGIDKNTLVIFTSDNGPEHYTYRLQEQFGHYSAGKLRGIKRDLWDGGHRVPFFVRWPGKVKAGAICGQTICLSDFMATAAAIVGYKLPNDAAEDSFNVLPLILSEKLDRPIRESVIHHSITGQLSIRRGDMKLIPLRGSGGNVYKTGPNAIKPDDPPGQLYDMSKDISERENLYTRYPELVKELGDLLEQQKTSGRSAPVR
ncbi:MAG: arylsulfatase [Tepidisphaerales bacterium]